MKIKDIGSPKLSILIPRLPNREVFWDMLSSLLRPQLKRYGGELITDPESGISIGQKRDRMLHEASGDYIVFIDDDDLVSHNYVINVLEALEKNPDCVGIHLLHYVDSRLIGKSYHTIQHDHWWDEPDPDLPGVNRYYRNPNHLNPVRRDIALKVGFPDLTFGEDREYSMGILKYLHNEIYIEEPIYYYYERAKKTI